MSKLLEKLFGLIDLRVVRPGLPNRIGHLALDFESYIKERLLQGRRRKPLYILDGREPCNKCMLEYWRQYIRIIDGRLAKKLNFLLSVPKIVDNLEHNYAYTLVGASPCYSIEAEWGDRPPLFKIKPDHDRRGTECLRQMGISDGQWFVCVHARGGGYSPTDEAAHAFRNVDIESYFDSMREIVRRGGRCIRVGDESMPPLPDIEGVYDYARSRFKSDWMDIFLCAKARFFLGSSSGLFLVSSAFGVPSALTNMAPMGCAYSFFRKDLSIPKLVRRPDGTLFSFSELLKSSIADMRWSHQFESINVTMQDNSSEEILGLVKEMLDRLDGCYVNNVESEIKQQRFRSLFHEGNYSFGSCARIGDDFLVRYEHLLNQD